ncbi:hypothetical protein [Tropicimonas isoalkanivorans]|uniref:Uncharacterized protein n=1 Tax=Tropicimonas isoalkanivorans TaxID=441112 RepID=A0A1I1IG84_9RHOB|nr:hypothetical protein [Tropicimonas isoalkanivorans]SFC35266.1 hypothetical protein SAMN04488094_10478 [Tropicimonas isoalkanivorans]
MANTERRNGPSGGHYYEHFDGHGNFVGRSEIRESIQGGLSYDHFDKYGVYLGHSEDRTGPFLNAHAERFASPDETLTDEPVIVRETWSEKMGRWTAPLRSATEKGRRRLVLLQQHWDPSAGDGPDGDGAALMPTVLRVAIAVANLALLIWGFNLVEVGNGLGWLPLLLGTLGVIYGFISFLRVMLTTLVAGMALSAILSFLI